MLQSTWPGPSSLDPGSLATAQSHLDAILQRITTDTRVLVRIVQHLLQEHRLEHATPPRLSDHRDVKVDGRYLVHRVPRTLAEELTEMEGAKRKREERTHFDGIPMCMIKQAERTPAARVFKTSKRIMGLENAMGCLQVQAHVAAPPRVATALPLRKESAEDSEESEDEDDEDDVVFVL